MSPEQIALVKSSFDNLWPMRRRFAAAFYYRFFQLAPEARIAFMSSANATLMDTIAVIVSALDETFLLESIVDRIEDDHLHFGVHGSRFREFGEALMWALERQFRAGFTPELRAAWSALYETIQREARKAWQAMTAASRDDDSGRPRVTPPTQPMGKKGPQQRPG